MKTSTEISSAARIVGEEKAIELIAKAGFSAWDFSMFKMCNYDWANGKVLPSDHPLAGSGAVAFAKKLKQVGLDNGIVCNQSHAPFPSCCAQIREKYKTAIECTAEAGGNICIIHPDNDKTAEENAEMYFELLPFAKSCNVKIATENMWNWNNEKKHAAPAACSSHADFLKHLVAVNDDYFVACLDIGHAEMFGLNTSAVQMIKTLGGKLQALHLHDNDLLHDNHQIPFSMQIDFNAVALALKQIGYSGYFTLEADSFLRAYNEDNVFSGVKELYSSVVKIVELFNKA